MCVYVGLTVCQQCSSKPLLTSNSFPSHDNDMEEDVTVYSHLTGEETEAQGG